MHARLFGGQSINDQQTAGASLKMGGATRKLAGASFKNAGAKQKNGGARVLRVNEKARLGRGKITSVTRAFHTALRMPPVWKGAFYCDQI